MSVRRLRGARGRIIVARDERGKRGPPPAIEASRWRAPQPSECGPGGMRSERARVDSHDATARAADGIDEMARAARTVAAAAVPQADADQLVGAERERALEQPEVGANEGVVARRQRAERKRRFARRLVEAVDDGAKARLPGGAIDHRQQRR